MKSSHPRATLSADTSAEAEAIQIQRWRAMSPREKATLVTQLCQSADAMALAQEAAAAGHETHAHGYQFLADTASAYGHLPLAPDWDGTITMVNK